MEESKRRSLLENILKKILYSAGYISKKGVSGGAAVFGGTVKNMRKMNNAFREGFRSVGDESEYIQEPAVSIDNKIEAPKCLPKREEPEVLDEDLEREIAKIDKEISNI
jgi:hypothetical protein